MRALDQRPGEAKTISRGGTLTEASPLNQRPAVLAQLEMQKRSSNNLGVVAQLRLQETLSRGAAPVQRMRIVNVGSGTDSDNMMKGDKGDEVVNVDSGHMEMANLLLRKPVGLFQALREEQGLSFNQGAYDNKVADMGEEDAAMVYKQFILRSLFEKFSGPSGFEQMMAVLEEKLPGFKRQWGGQMWSLEESGDFNFKQGFVENLSDVVSEPVDQIHAISALGFDLIRDERAIHEMVRVLAPGGKLFITAEKTGMVSKALRIKAGAPALDDNGKPMIKENLPLLDFFDYLPDESSYGGYKDVFAPNYPGMTTGHTTGGAFGGAVPFARLVFKLKEGAKDGLPGPAGQQIDPRLQEEFNLADINSEFDAYEYF